nr:MULTISPECIES: ABC transporter permease [unclassified Rhizobium]
MGVIVPRIASSRSDFRVNPLKIHLRVVFAFIIREIATRYGTKAGGYIWAFVQPIAFIAIMGALMGSVGRMPAMGESFILFYSTGYMAFNMFRAMEDYLTSSISANRALLTYPVVAPIDAVVGRFVLEALTSILVAAVIIGSAYHYAGHTSPIIWRDVFEAIAFAWAFAIGVAMTNMVLFFHYPLYAKFYAIVSRPLFLLSGIFYVPSAMPEPFSTYLLYNPITHIVILFREGFYGESPVSGLDMSFVLETSGAALALGFILFTFFNVSRLREK